MSLLQHRELRQPDTSAGMIHDQEPGAETTAGSERISYARSRLTFTNEVRDHRSIPQMSAPQPVSIPSLPLPPASRFRRQPQTRESPGNTSVQPGNAAAGLAFAT